MKRTQLLVSLALLSILAIPSLAATSVGATTTTYASKSINDLRAEQERLQKLAAEKQAAAKEEADAAAAAKAAIVKLDQQIDTTQAQINKTTNDIDSTVAAIDQTSRDITARETDIDLKQQRIQVTLRRLFKVQLTHEGIGWVGVAFGEDGLSRQVQENQNYDALKRELGRQRKELEDERNRLEVVKRDLEGRRSSLESLARQKEIQKEALARQQDQQAALKSDAERAYAQLKQEEKDALSKEAEVEAAITAQIQAQLRGGPRSSGAGTPVRQGTVIGHMGSTGFSTGPHVHFTVYTPQGATVNPRTRLGTFYIWPVTDYRITQEYGPANWRNPVYSFHNGIDLAGPAGQPVYAAADGKIILDQYYGGYGHAVVIEHPDGFLSLYGHMTGK